MRRQQRRDSAREWVRSGAAITVKSYAKRYGVDGYTAYDDLTTLGVTLPASAQRWVQRPPSTPRPVGRRDAVPGDNSWIMVEGGRSSSRVSPREGLRTASTKTK